MVAEISPREPPPPGENLQRIPHRFNVFRYKVVCNNVLNQTDRQREREREREREMMLRHGRAYSWKTTAAVDSALCTPFVDALLDHN